MIRAYDEHDLTMVSYRFLADFDARISDFLLIPSTAVASRIGQQRVVRAGNVHEHRAIDCM